MDRAKCPEGTVNQNASPYTGFLILERHSSGRARWCALRLDATQENPVRAKMVNEATDWIWSSARCHAALCADDLLAPSRPFPGMETDWPAFLARGLTTAEVERIRVNTATGRPTGSEAFVKKLEQTTGRLLRPLKRGVKPGGSTHSEAPMDDLFS